MLEGHFRSSAKRRVKKAPQLFLKNQDVHNIKTRYRNKLHVPHINTTLARNGPHYKFIKFVLTTEIY